jgi:hypothetical protein
MVVVDWKQRGLSLEARGRYGEPCGVGDMWLGFSSVGEFDDMQGVYQKRPRKKGQIFVRMKYAIDPNNYSAVRQANRDKFRNAIIAWNALSFEDQILWNKKTYPAHCSGYNRFISAYMKA